MKYLSLLMMGGLFLSASCNAQNKTKDGFTVLPGGLQYKTIVKGDGTHTGNPGDIAEVNLVFKISDSTIFNSFKANNGQPIKQGLTSPKMKDGLMHGLLKMKEGDSTVFRIVIDSLAKRSHRPLPKFAKSGDYARWDVKLVHLMTKEEEAKAQNEAAKKQKVVDDSLIRSYLNEHHISNYKKTASGLYYVVHKKGEGATPKKGDKVTVNYTGKLPNGKEFDSNVNPKFKHVKPFQFPLGQHRVIEGWDEGVALMNKGEKATFYIPSSMAYGAQGRPGAIPQNAILIFDIELVNFE